MSDDEGIDGGHVEGLLRTLGLTQPLLGLPLLI
jgi:hypothetical protein